jgi:hypothetical protein
VHLQAIHSTPAMGDALLKHLKDLHPGAWFFSEMEARVSGSLKLNGIQRVY